MSPPGRPKGEYRSAQHEGNPVSAATLVVELFTEELPPKALRRLGGAFAETLAAGLRQQGFLTDGSAVTPYATPRRLAVSITQVLAVAPDAEVIDKLMPAKVARGQDGQPSEALRKKLGALGRAHLATATLDATDGPDRIYVASDGKADYVYLKSLAKGQALAGGLQAALDDALAKLPIPKVMTYASPDGFWNAEKFVRPAHRLLALHGADVVARAGAGPRRRAGRPAATASSAGPTSTSAPPTPTRRRSGPRARSSRRSTIAAPRSKRASPGPRRATGSSRPTRCSTKSPRWSSGRPSTPAPSTPPSSRCRRNA